MMVWRGEQCPQRGAGLTHIADYKQRPDGSCVFCGSSLNEAQPTVVSDPKPETVLPVDQTLIEPKMITGNGPQGRVAAPGRGDFTSRDEDRTVSYVGWREFLARNGGGEHG